MKFALASLGLFALLGLFGCISRDLRALSDHGDESTRILVIAHRGASAYAPENTFAAFDKAQELGAVAAETDIQLSKDGKLVIFHDDTLDKKTNLKGPVRSHTWAELQDVDMAPWFAKRASTTKMPPNPLTRLITLDDLFERYGMTFSYNIEIKATDEQIPALALKTVKEYGLKENVTFTSFHVEQLTRLRALDKDIPLCYLIDDKKTPDIGAEIVRAKTLGFNEVSIRAPIVTHDQAKRAREAHLKVISWGVKNDDDMKRAVQAGVSGMTTDWPDRLMKIIQTPVFR
jgi:glycerophosphoryl diester phosphodiesterase